MEFLSQSRERSPRETSPAARNEEKRLFSQAMRNAVSGEVGVTIVSRGVVGLVVGPPLLTMV